MVVGITKVLISLQDNGDYVKPRLAILLARVLRVCMRCKHVISCDTGLKKNSRRQGFYGRKGVHMGLDLYLDP